MALLDMVAELTGTLPGLSPILAQKYIRRAYRQILDKRSNWSFLETEGWLVCPAMVSTGTIAITQYASTVTLDAAASAVLLAQADPNAVPGLKSLQIRFGASPQLGGVYTIVDFDISTPTAIVLTIERPVLEATNATSAYQCYRAYIAPPDDDFLKWETLTDLANYITIDGGRITLKSADFDRRDPQRTSQGLAYYLGGAGGNKIANPVTGSTTPLSTQDASTPIYELWPHPTSGQSWYCRYWRKGQDLVNPSDVPATQISESLIMARAFGWFGYPFAMANTPNFPTMKGANWPMLIATSKADFAEEWKSVVRNDEAQQLQSVWNRGHGLRTGSGNPAMPIDAQYIQSHLLNW